MVGAMGISMPAVPVLPSPVAYTFRTENQGQVDLAEAMLWAEGVFVKGYLRFLQANGQPVPNPENYLVSGSLIDDTLRLTQYGAGPVSGGEETVDYLTIHSFSFEGSWWTGKYTRFVHTWPFRDVIEGTFELTRKDWSR